MLSNWFVTEDYRAKAQIKYELRQLEGRLNMYLDVHSDLEYCSNEVSTLCSRLAYGYLDYLKLIDINNKTNFAEFSLSNERINWNEYFNLIVHLKEQLSKTVDLKEEAQFITEIASLYYRCTQSIKAPGLCASSIPESHEALDQLIHIFNKQDSKLWLAYIVNLWNQNDVQHSGSQFLFRNWNIDCLQYGLNFFSERSLVNLVNAIFFYKLYPDKLFNELIHPEKLVSIRMRIGILHEYIELLQKQLYNTAKQHGLKPGIDLLFHGDDLPQGIMIEVNTEYREIIQSAIKNLKVRFTSENEEQVTRERLLDLGRAYKFWFNPNRLIDAVMVLQQRLVKEKLNEANNLSILHREMVLLYRQLNTTECMDLYGYFANNDSRYLLYTLYTIVQDKPLDWLPSLNKEEKYAIKQVFLALQCVMEALREELNNRCILTEPYIYDLGKQYVQVGRRNRDAVFRIIAIYGREAVSISDSVEKLFNSVESTSQ